MSTTIRASTSGRGMIPPVVQLLAAHQPQEPRQYQDGGNHPKHGIVLSLDHGFTVGWRLRYQPAATGEPPCSWSPPWSFGSSTFRVFGSTMEPCYAVGRLLPMGCNPTWDHCGYRAKRDTVTGRVRPAGQVSGLSQMDAEPDPPGACSHGFRESGNCRMDRTSRSSFIYRQMEAVVG